MPYWKKKDKKKVRDRTATSIFNKEAGKKQIECHISFTSSVAA
jgi:hypothetical protein